MENLLRFLWMSIRRSSSPRYHSSSQKDGPQKHWDRSSMFNYHSARSASTTLRKVAIHKKLAADAPANLRPRKSKVIGPSRTLKVAVSTNAAVAAMGRPITAGACKSANFAQSVGGKAHRTCRRKQTSSKIVAIAATMYPRPTMARLSGFACLAFRSGLGFSAPGVI